MPAPLQSGVVQGVFAADLRTAAAQLADDIVAEQRRVVICQLNDPPAHTRLLDCLAQELAQAALLLWPDWYGPHVQLSEESATTRVTTDSNLKTLLNAQVRVDAAWFRRASLLANRSQRPCVPDTSVTRQVRELAACLRYEDICIIVTIALPAAEDHRLHTILQALEWLARETDAPVVAVTAENAVPADCQVPFHPITAPESAAVPVEEEFRQRILPFVGRPHPYSPGERQLAAALATDHELTGLFEFNQPITVASGSRFVVDLLWSQGKVVVEVDGYSNHSHPEMFCSDRHRDYELLISDYAVLRVPHTDVINNVEAVMQKIRQVVRWRSKGETT
ncbi:MAG: endonuclease domain-containing protein [Planctomycetaceae bacterium]|nr:endonuclease domain-containing protein [Planctomycetaceae bacterium]